MPPRPIRGRVPPPSRNRSPKSGRRFLSQRISSKRPGRLPPTKRQPHPRVLVVHYAPVTRLGLSILLARSGRFTVCGQADGTATARGLFEQYQPELVITGLSLRGGDGIELIKDFRKLHPACRTLVLSKRDDALAVQRAFRAGARAYLTGSDDTHEILQALDRILLGELYASECIRWRLVENLILGRPKPNNSKLESLSDRELQVFSMFGRGYGVTKIAAELHLSVKTIETHQKRIKEKLDLRSAAELSKDASAWMNLIAQRQLSVARLGQSPMRRTPD